MVETLAKLVSQQNCCMQREPHSRAKNPSLYTVSSWMPKLSAQIITSTIILLVHMELFLFGSLHFCHFFGCLLASLQMFTSYFIISYCRGSKAFRQHSICNSTTTLVLHIHVYMFLLHKIMSKSVKCSLNNNCVSTVSDSLPVQYINNHLQDFIAFLAPCWFCCCTFPKSATSSSFSSSFSSSSPSPSLSCLI